MTIVWEQTIDVRIHPIPDTANSEYLLFNFVCKPVFAMKFFMSISAALMTLHSEVDIITRVISVPQCKKC